VVRNSQPVTHVDRKEKHAIIFFFEKKRLKKNCRFVFPIRGASGEFTGCPSHERVRQSQSVAQV